MSHLIPKDARRLITRLRDLADEIESAARYGIPIPFMVSLSGHEYGDASFNATEEEFAAWAEYTEARVERYESAGSEWSRAEVDVNGLPMSFATRHVAIEVSS